MYVLSWVKPIKSNLIHMNNLNSHAVSQKAIICHPIKEPQFNINFYTGATETHK
jgi:hypothetical protein